jgi:predicted GH43/DUF377 family glycosyl hydrolase
VGWPVAFDRRPWRFYQGCTHSKYMADLARRFKRNPLLRPEDIRPSAPGLQIECLLNPGVFKYDGKTWLLLRVAERPKQEAGKVSFPILGANGAVEILEFDEKDPRLDRSDPRILKVDGREYLTTLSHLRLVSSANGIDFVEEESGGSFAGEGDLEAYGIEDSRVATIEGNFYLTYTAVSKAGVGVGMRSTRDWKRFTPPQMIFPPHNKDCALFEEKVGGKYYALHRPSSPGLGGNYIWLGESPDLLHWGNHRCLAMTRPGSWDSGRVGAGAAPIRTSEGWLEIYHGANKEQRYCLGLLLLDLNEPWRVLARSEEPIMEPVAEYERAGFFGNVVFTNGHLVEGDKVTMYYGASDSVICGATFSISELLGTLR